MTKREIKIEKDGALLKLIIDDKYKTSFAVAGDNSNCKLSYIHNIGILRYYITNNDEMKFVIDELLKHQKGCVFINTTNENIATFISQTYPTYFFHEVPIGYSNGYQYHVCIKNIIKPNHNCRLPEQEKKVVVEKVKQKKYDSYTKTKVEKLLRTHLKENNQSTKFVNKFIRELTKR